MGYMISQIESDFFIAADKKDAALEAVKKLADTVQQNGSGATWGGGLPESRHYSWVSTLAFAQAPTLEEALLAWNFEPTTDDEGNITDIYFIGQKLGDYDYLFNALGPFVEDGSYITWLGEDGFQWRNFFNGTEMVVQNARVVWE